MPQPSCSRPRLCSCDSRDARLLVRLSCDSGRGSRLCCGIGSCKRIDGCRRRRHHNRLWRFLGQKPILFNKPFDVIHIPSTNGLFEEFQLLSTLRDFVHGGSDEMQLFRTQRIFMVFLRISWGLNGSLWSSSKFIGVVTDLWGCLFWDPKNRPAALSAASHLDDHPCPSGSVAVPLPFFSFLLR